MTTLSQNPLASPANQPQASTMSQYPMSGMQMQPEPTAQSQQMTPGQRGILSYRRAGGPPMGAPQARTGVPGALAPPTGGRGGAPATGTDPSQGWGGLASQMQARMSGMTPLQYAQQQPGADPRALAAAGGAVPPTVSYSDPSVGATNARGVMPGAIRPPTATPPQGIMGQSNFTYPRQAAQPWVVGGQRSPAGGTIRNPLTGT